MGKGSVQIHKKKFKKKERKKEIKKNMYFLFS